MLLVDDRLTAARDHAKAGRHDNATILYEGILDIAPGHPEALCHLLEQRLLEGDLDGARERMGRATSRTMQDPRFLTLCAKVMMLSGKTEDAERFVDRALALDEAYPDAVMMKAEFLAASGQIPEAEVLLTTLRNHLPANTDVLLAIARLYAGYGLLGPALEVAQDAVRTAPGQANANAFVADLLTRLCDHAKATPFFEKAHLAGPNNPTYLLGLAANCEEVGQTSEALRLAKRATLLFPESVDGWLLYIKIMAGRNEAAEALRAFMPIAKRIPDAAMATLALATAYRLAGHPAQALKLLAPLFSSAQTLGPALRSQAMALMRNSLLATGQVDAAGATLDGPVIAQALRIPPEDIQDPGRLKARLEEAAFVIDPATSNLELMTLIRFARVFSPQKTAHIVGPAALGQLIDLFGFQSFIANDVPTTDPRPGDPKPSFPVSQFTALPAAVRGEVSAPVPYLEADPGRIGRWRTALADYPKPWIGVAWDGDPTKITLDTLMPALTDLGGTLVAVNWDDTRHQLNGRTGILDGGKHFSSLHDLAALSACLDCVIGPDTLALHAAGALQTPGVVVLAFDRPWYWADRDGHCLWYPSIVPVGAPQNGRLATLMPDLVPQIRTAALNLLASGGKNRPS
ncbi:hypothetical protein GCM10011316_17470 [Roseibium aquae]|uniref:Tetratricopeptide repeat protein n=1 Tax=Roseibium aquae TaxID=1323746 RepID=A0A916TJ45_9HYPH|nr:tetratricopeptide repeat protein [Roseibium aquae]GGB45863.1 hypothetical protein GCM10011316_17470 [Roseibium aquae]